MQEVKTRSSNLIKNPLESLFEPSEKEVETYVDVLRDFIQEDLIEDSSRGNLRRIVSGEVDRVIAPKPLSSSLSGFVRLFHGWHRGDYVWHIEHAAIRRPWKASIDRVIYTIASIMHDFLPDVEAKIWPPKEDWELKTITFKALNLDSYWNFNEADIEKINQVLLSSLNKLV